MVGKRHIRSEYAGYEMPVTLERQNSIMERRERVRELYVSNPNMRAIAREIGVSEGTVRKDVKAMQLFGYDKPHQGRPLVPKLPAADAPAYVVNECLALLERCKSAEDRGNWLKALDMLSKLFGLYAPDRHLHGHAEVDAVMVHEVAYVESGDVVVISDGGTDSGDSSDILEVETNDIVQE